MIVYTAASSAAESASSAARGRTNTVVGTGTIVIVVVILRVRPAHNVTQKSAPAPGHIKPSTAVPEDQEITNRPMGTQSKYPERNAVHAKSK